MSATESEQTASLILPQAAKPVIAKIRELMATGRLSEALASFSELDGFERANPRILKLTKGTLLVDLAHDLADVGYARRGISLITQIAPDDLPESARRSYWYNLGNGYGAAYHATKIRASVGRAQNEDFRQAKYCYRRALALTEMSPDSSARLCTNYGILLRTVGRHVEEIEAYDDALKAAPEFAMALWHKARGLGWYAKLVERPTKSSALLEAWRLLRRTLDVGVGLEPARRVKVEKDFTELNRILKQPKIAAHNPTKHETHSDIEEKYVRFCVENRLYLHPCPVESHEAYQDPLSIRFPTDEKDVFRELRWDLLATIKHEYICARFLLFSYRSEMPDLSFVDRGTFLPATRENRGQVYLQMLNLSLRACLRSPRQDRLLSEYLLQDGGEGGSHLLWGELLSSKSGASPRASRL